MHLKPSLTALLLQVTQRLEQHTLLRSQTSAHEVSAPMCPMCPILNQEAAAGLVSEVSEVSDFLSSLRVRSSLRFSSYDYLLVSKMGFH